MNYERIMKGQDEKVSFLQLSLSSDFFNATVAIEFFLCKRNGNARHI